MRFDKIESDSSNEEIQLKNKSLIVKLQTKQKWKKICNFILNEDNEEFLKVVRKLKKTDLNQISRNIKQTRAVFSKYFKMKHNSRKSPNKRKGVLMAKATLSRKEKPLITDTIKRKVTEILRIGLFNKIKLLSANKVCVFILTLKEVEQPSTKDVDSDLSEVKESSNLDSSGMKF